ncbi:MAG: FAD binding domain-containing protein [Acidimicrobiia bacterium]
MYPAKFEYLAPTTLDEALSTLAERGDEARVLAGGQSLIPMMKLRFATPAMLVDINRIPGLDFIEETDGQLRVGALVRHNDIVDSEIVGRTNHTMAAAAPWISDPLVRNLGTVCGSVAHCDPQGDWASVMLAVGAEVVASGASGERVIPITDFVVDMFTNALEPGEMVTEVRIPKYTAPAGGTYLKLERKIGDYATVGVATHLELDGSGKIANAGIALTSVAPKNTKAVEAEQALVGEAPGDELFAEAAELAAQASDPASDVRGSAEYKRDVVRVFTRRGLAEAHELAQAS